MIILFAQGLTICNQTNSTGLCNEPWLQTACCLFKLETVTRWKLSVEDSVSEMNKTFIYLTWSLLTLQLEYRTMCLNSIGRAERCLSVVFCHCQINQCCATLLCFPVYSGCGSSWRKLLCLSMPHSSGVKCRRCVHVAQPGLHHQPWAKQGSKSSVWVHLSTQSEKTLHLFLESTSVLNFL